MSLGHTLEYPSLVSTCTHQYLRFFFNYDVFIASFPFWIYRCNIVPNLEHTTLFISVPNGFVFLKNISSTVNLLYWGCKIIWYSSTHLPFFYPRINLPVQFVKPVNYPMEFPKVIGTFYQRINEGICPKRPELLKTCQGYTAFKER